MEQEKVTSIDFGYRGNIGPVSLDANVYYNSYDGFINNQIVITPENGNIADGSAIGDIVNGTFKAMQLYTNSTAEISSY